MARKKRTKEELVAASDHLKYEVDMFFDMAQAIASGEFEESAIGNALLESFTVHTRVLLDFLYGPPNIREDDVLSDDFFDDVSMWAEKRPPKSDLLDSVHARVGKEIAHLTYARQNISVEQKQWAFLQIANEVKPILVEFLSLINQDLLGQRWRPLPAEWKPQARTSTD